MKAVISDGCGRGDQRESRDVFLRRVAKSMFSLNDEMPLASSNSSEDAGKVLLQSAKTKERVANFAGGTD